MRIHSILIACMNSVFRRSSFVSLVALAFVLLVCASDATAQIRFEREPIRYSDTLPQNRVTDLIAGIDSGRLLPQMIMIRNRRAQRTRRSGE